MHVCDVRYTFRVTYEEVEDMCFSRGSVALVDIENVLAALRVFSTGTASQPVVDFLLAQYENGAQMLVYHENDLRTREYVVAVDVRIPRPEMIVQAVPEEERDRYPGRPTTRRVENPNYVLPLPMRRAAPPPPPAPPQEPAQRRLNFRRLKSISQDPTGG